jgi:hypothetical protein
MPPIKRRREAAELQAVLAQKKARSAARSAHVPKEVFAILARRLVDSPSALLRLSMVCRDARDVVLGESADVWYEICRRSQDIHFK